MRTVAIIQARVGSTRLPGKVLMPLAGQPVLVRVAERVGAARGLDEVVIATTTSPADDAIADLCDGRRIRCFRGSEFDVLGRYAEASKAFKAEAIVRVSSDCPLFDPDVLTQMLKRFAEDTSIDYLSNFQKRTFPRGFEAEIFKFLALETAHKAATKPYEREHVTPFIYQNPNRFHLASYEGPIGEEDITHLRWTLDTPADFQVIEAIYNELSKSNRLFTTAEILNLLRRRPELTRINAHVEQKTLTG